MTISCVFSGGSSVPVLLEEGVNWSFDPSLSSLSDKNERRRFVSELKCRMNSLCSKVGITVVVLPMIASTIVPVHPLCNGKGKWNISGQLGHNWKTASVTEIER